MKKVTLTAITILATLTLTACGNKTTEQNNQTLTSTINKMTSQEKEVISEEYPELADTYPGTSTTETEEVEDNTPEKVIVPSTSLEWFVVKTQASSGFTTKVRCENDPEPTTMASGSVYAMSQVTTENGYSTITVVNFAQRSNNVVKFYLNTNEPGIVQSIAQQFIRYMVNLKPDGNLTNGMASNAQYWLEHGGLTQDVDNEE